MVRVKLNQTAIEVAMSRQNLSQRDLAAKIGFSRSHVSLMFPRLILFI
jgi:putative transcriptional regulator